MPGNPIPHNYTVGGISTYVTGTLGIDPTIDAFPGIDLSQVNQQIVGVALSISYTDGTDQNLTMYYPISINKVDSANDLGFEYPKNISTTVTGLQIFIEFIGTNPQSIQLFNLNAIRARRYFNDWMTRINTTNGLIIVNAGVNGLLKINLTDCTITPADPTNANKSITLILPANVDTGNGSTITPAHVTDLEGLMFFALDDELILGNAGVITKAGYLNANIGVMGRSSILYQDFFNGVIKNTNVVQAKANANAGDNVTVTADFVNTGSDYRITFTAPVSLATNVSSSFEVNNTFSITGSGQGNDKKYRVLQVIGPDTLVVDGPLVDETNVDLKIYFEFDGDNELRYIKGYTQTTGSKTTMSLEWMSSNDLIGNGTTFQPAILVGDTNEILITSKRSNFAQTLEVEQIYTEPNKIAVSASRYTEVQVGDYILAVVDNSELDIASGEVGRTLTRVIDKVIDNSNPSNMILTTDAPIDVRTFTVNGQPDYYTYTYKSIDNYVSTYKGFGLNGFKVHKDSMPDGTQERQDFILDLISRGTPLFKALANRNAISWRYLVDSFGLGLQTRSKQQYVDLCGEKLQCFGFISAPSERQFRQSTSPSFINADGSVNYEYVKAGADPNKIAAYRYTLGDGPGRSCVGYFYPYVTVNDRGVPTNVPPASFVANTYMQKFLSRSSSIRPWTVAAGIETGIVTGISNVETDLLPDEEGFLIDAGINSIVYKMDIDFVLNHELTAQIRPQSSLSFIHSRELLIELENELYNMLLGYQWKFNTPELRQEVYSRANTICQRYKEQDGLYAFENVIDESNNTYEIIDTQFGLLDTYIEITKAMGFVVNNIYILKSGDIASGGFRNATNFGRA